MKIVANNNIPFAEDAFRDIGKIEILPADRINASSVADADILLIRSTTRVDRNLLEGSQVRFVATSTIGIDHMDVVYMKAENIEYASAAGSNSNSVAEYISAALLSLSQKLGFRLRDKTLAVVGVGNVGSKVVRYAEGLGMRVLQNDPPLQRLTGDPRYRPLADLMEADIITIHVPLTREGADATYHLFDAEQIPKMKKGSILMNSSRGPVVSGMALNHALNSGYLAASVLDVWEGEPAIDMDLLNTVDIGTPHIAGHSFDGKVNGTQMIYQAACEYLGIEAQWEARNVMPNPDDPDITIRNTDLAEEKLMNEVVKQVYNIHRDDASLREISTLPPDQQSPYFKKLRNEYRRRREFFNFNLQISKQSGDLVRKLATLGFNI